MQPKTTPKRKWLWAAALTAALLALWLQHHTATRVRPKAADEGAVFRTTQIAGNAKTLGIHTITLNLDNGRANRLNARRDPKMISANPIAFGPEAPFKPLATVGVQGPGNLEVQGDGPTGRIRTAIPSGNYAVEIYPEFIRSKLFSGKADEEETLRFYFEPSAGGRINQAQERLEWSGPEELFLSSKNLIDLAALTKPVERGHPSTTPARWLTSFGKTIRNERLEYESEPASQGWQPIRGIKPMREAGAANCLDIALLTAQKAKSAGFSPHILATSGHALCAVAPLGRPVAEATFFEGTEFLVSKETKVRPPKQNVIEKILVPNPTPKPPAPNTAPPRALEAPDTFVIDLDKWEPFYRAP